MSIDEKLKSLGINLPTPPSSVANYVPYKVTGNLVFVSGQLPLSEGTVTFKGKVGQDLSLEQGQEAARLCAINILTHLKAACGGELKRVKECLRLGGFVNCLPDFMDQPKVINGASDLLVDVFGESGRHARAAVGVNALPLGAAVEVEATFLIE
ncbi:MAG TPA: RidA family protein [Candidatus Nitrosotenuis sp.]|jgi:enamine deaminase RidA (YjgF/YER057c/UK114 family)|nr:RidA family protein [Candidatus Nitrosotenuis sp.]